MTAHKSYRFAAFHGTDLTTVEQYCRVVMFHIVVVKKQELVDVVIVEQFDYVVGVQYGVAASRNLMSMASVHQPDLHYSDKHYLNFVGFVMIVEPQFVPVRANQRVHYPADH